MWRAACLAATAVASPVPLLHELLPELDLQAQPGQAASGPYLVPAWIADFKQVTGATSMGTFSGKFSRDATNQRFRLWGCSPQPVFQPDGKMCYDQLSKNISDGPQLNLTYGTGPQAGCKEMSSPYSDIFAALRLSKFQRNDSTASGEPCAIWALYVNTKAIQTNITACIASDGSPRELNTSSSIAYKAASKSTLTFSNVQVGPQGDEVFTPSEVCKKGPLPPCKFSGVDTLDIYRVRSLGEPNELDNRNVGDGLGDMAFFCALGEGIDPNEVVSRWTVEVNKSYGPYRYCIYTKAIGNFCSGSGNLVGRQSALGLGIGDAMGQCSPNNDTGSWLSIPKTGKCPPGARVGDGGCTWTARPLRTVKASCIFSDRGLQKVCNEERGHAPLLRSAAIFEAALATSDPQKGGCPDAVAAEASPQLLVV